MKRALMIAIVASVLAAGCRPGTQPSPVSGAEPVVVGKRIAENWLQRRFIFETTTEPGPYNSNVHYAEVGTWYGALEFAHRAHDADLERRLIAKYDRFRTPEGMAHVSRQRHVDFSIFGVVPLEIYRLTGDSALRSVGLGFADRQWSDAGRSGISTEARYWSDDLFMLPMLQLQAYRATGDRKYLDRTARFAIAYLDSLQKSNGLFFHGLNSPYYWGRGNGWAAAGLTQILTSLPENHPDRPRILAGYHLMMNTLLEAQSPRGLWRQLITRPEVWEESSGSAMFAYAMITGVRRGWLDARRFGPAGQRAWTALVSEVDEHANVRDICVGTGRAFDVVGSDLDAQYRYYVARPRTSGDLHGQAPMLWAAAALLGES